ncbi:hypothetical protein [Leptospira licerasiae]|uniref:hypothetical protein n=1 Tax=Leptospira licerasiae TaxID=447106 RepID=UPI0010840B3F|nr:hypothetical protein [Leptospira licerasiae]TGM87897.1 hypothetical protein EHR05_14675 [Leptospira licerasiae]
MMINFLILRRAPMSLEYIEFRKRLSNVEPKDITIKIVKKDLPYVYQICALIGTDFAAWTHNDEFQLEKNALFAEGLEDKSLLLMGESVTELFERASKSHELEFIIE